MRGARSDVDRVWNSESVWSRTGVSVGREASSTRDSDRGLRGQQVLGPVTKQSVNPYITGRWGHLRQSVDVGTGACMGGDREAVLLGRLPSGQLGRKLRHSARSPLPAGTRDRFLFSSARRHRPRRLCKDVVVP